MSCLFSLGIRSHYVLPNLICSTFPIMVRRSFSLKSKWSETEVNFFFFDLKKVFFFHFISTQAKHFNCEENKSKMIYEKSQLICIDYDRGWLSLRGHWWVLIKKTGALLLSSKWHVLKKGLGVLKIPSHQIRSAWKLYSWIDLHEYKTRRW
jgi:hypothetical protein